VQPGETIVDMFAGIGYFSLPIAVHAQPACIYAIEINPEAYEFLSRNVALNDVREIVHPILGDCAKEVEKLADQGVIADRVIMGVFPAPKEYLPHALLVVKPEGGTIIHYEGVVEKHDVNPLFQDVIDACAAIGRAVQLREHRIVKSYGPFKYHAVLDCEIL
jgi:tRNA wybutosine-synthesizing protein 2